MTHSELVVKAERWLRGTQRCKVAYANIQGWALREFPDAIGWTWRLASYLEAIDGRPTEVLCKSILVECKATLSDFHSDKGKSHRDGHGMGRYRYFLCPKGLVTPEQVQQDWGLLWLCGSRVYEQRRAPDRGEDAVRLRRENLFLALRLMRAPKRMVW